MLDGADIASSPSRSHGQASDDGVPRCSVGTEACACVAQGRLEELAEGIQPVSD